MHQPNETNGKENKGSVLYIIVPCYNEEDVLPITAPKFLTKLHELIDTGKIDDRSKIMFVDDGSKDKTWEIIRELSALDDHYIGIAQSRNRGHQNALLAGLMEAKGMCDMTISIDCDGQDDINAMNEMVDAYLDGCEIVYGVRSKRETDTFFKRFTAETFYKMMDKMGVETVYNHADYRLVSSRVLEEFANFEEVNIFLRGMFPLVGFKSTSVYYERKERVAGKSHYPLSKMMALAIEGITSLSTKPIRMIIHMGLFVLAVCALVAIYAVVQLVKGNTVPGWTSIMITLIFLGGMQLIAIGIIGEYVGKTYMESKHRPRYIIREKTYEKQNEERQR